MYVYIKMSWFNKKQKTSIWGNMSQREIDKFQDRAARAAAELEAAKKAAWQKEQAIKNAIRLYNASVIAAAQQKPADDLAAAFTMIRAQNAAKATYDNAVSSSRGDAERRAIRRVYNQSMADAYNSDPDVLAIEAAVNNGSITEFTPEEIEAARVLKLEEIESARDLKLQEDTTAAILMIDTLKKLAVDYVRDLSNANTIDESNAVRIAYDIAVDKATSKDLDVLAIIEGILRQEEEEKNPTKNAEIEADITGEEPIDTGPPIDLADLKFSDSDSNSTYAPGTYHAFPSSYGSIKIVATMETSGLVSSIKINEPFKRRIKGEQPGNFTKAIKAKQLILVKGMSGWGYVDYCNGYDEGRVNIIGGKEAVVSVSPNGGARRKYTNMDVCTILRNDGIARYGPSANMYENNNFDYGNNFVWVPPKTIVIVTIDKNSYSWDDRAYRICNNSDKYICYHINRLMQVWSTKIHTDTVKLRTKLRLTSFEVNANMFYIAQLDSFGEEIPSPNGPVVENIGVFENDRYFKVYDDELLPSSSSIEIKYITTT
jgi:hypothetical protein